MFRRVLIVGITIMFLVSASVAGWSKTGDYKDHYKISWADHVLLEDFEEKNRIWQYVEKKFNVTFDYRYEDHVEVRDKQLMWAYAGTLPDMFKVYHDSITYQLWEEGFLTPIEDIVKKYPGRWPNIEKYMNWPLARVYASMPDGKVYGVPYFHCGEHGFNIRKDWLDKLGLKMPGTMEDLYNVLKAFKKHDPDGTKNLGLTTEGIWWMQHVLAAWTGAWDWTVRNEGFAWAPLLPEAKEGFKFLRRLYAEGLLDPEFHVHQRPDALEKFYSGRAGVILTNSSESFITMAESKLKEAGFRNANVIPIVPFPAGPAGPIRGATNLFFYGTVVINSKVPKAKVERILDIMDWVVSPEGDDIMTNGLEGIHYVWKDGKRIVNWGELRKDQMTSPDGAFRRKAVPFAGSWGTSEGFPWAPFIWPGPKQDILKTQLHHMFTEKQVIHSAVQGYQSEVTRMYGGKLYDVFATYGTRFITGELDIDSSWNDYLKAAEQAGYKKLIQDLNKNYKIPKGLLEWYGVNNWGDIPKKVHGKYRNK